MPDQLELGDGFEAGEAAAAPAEPGEPRVRYVAGVLAQTAWGSGERTRAQVAASVDAAIEAIRRLRGG